MLWRWAPLLAAFTVGCLPPLSDVEGKACNDEKPCPDALLCVAGVCRRSAPEVDAGVAKPPELLFEDGFENGLTSWTTTGMGRMTRVTAPVRRGANSCRLTVSDGPAGAYGLETLSTQLPVREGLYCASVWVSQTALASTLTVSLRRFGGAGGLALLAESPKGAASHVLADAGTPFRQARAALPVDVASTSSVVVTIQGEAKANAQSVIDDVSIWLSFDGGCPE